MIGFAEAVNSEKQYCLSSRLSIHGGTGTNAEDHLNERFSHFVITKHAFIQPAPALLHEPANDDETWLPTSGGYRSSILLQRVFL